MEIFDILTYDYNKVQNVLNLPETYTVINTLTTPVRVAGLYTFGFSMTSTYSVTTASQILQFSLDGGATWSTEILSESSDQTDVLVESYGFPMEWAGGVFTGMLRVRKETAQGTYDVQYCDLVFRRVQ